MYIRRNIQRTYVHTFRKWKDKSCLHRHEVRLLRDVFKWTYDMRNTSTNIFESVWGENERHLVKSACRSRLLQRTGCTRREEQNKKLKCMYLVTEVVSEFIKNDPWIKCSQECFVNSFTLNSFHFSTTHCQPSRIHINHLIRLFPLRFGFLDFNKF